MVLRVIAIFTPSITAHQDQVFVAVKPFHKVHDNALLLCISPHSPKQTPRCPCSSPIQQLHPLSPSGLVKMMDHHCTVSYFSSTIRPRIRPVAASQFHNKSAFVLFSLHSYSCIFRAALLRIELLCSRVFLPISFVRNHNSFLRFSLVALYAPREPAWNSVYTVYSPFRY